MRSPDGLADLIRAKGLKLTPQRLAVFEALYEDESHPTADIVWARVRRQLPSVSLRTVYQALNDLVDLGEVQAVSVDSGAVRYDPNVSHHAHFVCRCCASVYDVEASNASLLGTHGSQHDAGSTDYVIETVEITFRGRCPACR
jgi:Fe2+ or Zn2+ uptake regulation protein